jgi:hypothetical protein
MRLIVTSLPICALLWASAPVASANAQDAPSDLPAGAETEAGTVVVTEEPDVAGRDALAHNALLAHRAHVEGPIARYQMLCRVRRHAERAFVFARLRCRT